jgi:TolA-binding protein
MDGCYEARELDEAIPMLQAAQTDPRSRHQCQFLMGRAFFEKGSYAQAAAVLTELRDAYELADDLSKDILYWLARSLEADGQTEEAKATYGRLLRQDYNYAQGDARKRLEALK